MSSTTSLYSDILSNILTEEDRTFWLVSLRDARLSSYLPKKLPQAFYSSTKVVFEKLKTREKILEFFKVLEDKLKRLRIFELTIAFSPTREFVQEMLMYVRKNFDEDIVLKIQNDEGIIGGAVVSFEGKYKDLSVRARLEEKKL